MSDSRLVRGRRRRRGREPVAALGLLHLSGQDQNDAGEDRAAPYDAPRPIATHLRLTSVGMTLAALAVGIHWVMQRSAGGRAPRRTAYQVNSTMAWRADDVTPVSISASIFRPPAPDQPIVEADSGQGHAES